MRIGIIGPEKRKFTPESAQRLRALIREVTAHATEIVSGQWLGNGVDLAARTIADTRGIPYTGFPPYTNELIGHGLWKRQNIVLAEYCDEVICFVLATLPPAFIGRGGKPLTPLCRECGGAHYTCAGCWTVEQARLRGKRGRTILIEGGDTVSTETLTRVLQAEHYRLVNPMGNP